MRQISEKQSAALKAVSGRSLGLAGGGAIACHSTRIGEGQLSKCASMNPDNEKAFLPIDVAVELDMLAGSPIITSLMAELQGYRLVPAGSVESEPDVLDLGDALNVANESNDVVRAITEALAGGKVCAADRQSVNREIEEAIRALRTVQSKIGGAA